jgi:hypothetical protein
MCCNAISKDDELLDLDFILIVNCCMFESLKDVYISSLDANFSIVLK